MSTKIRVRGYLDVTIRVPHEFEIDLAEFKEWAVEPTYVTPEKVREFIVADTSDEWVRGWPNADPHVHEVADYELNDIEVIGLYGEATS